MHRLILLVVLLSLSGCTTLGYYGQAISGQFAVIAGARPIDELLEDPTTAPELKARLTLIQSIREFAVRELGLPDNDSYRRYTDLGRPAALWNVFATPELSLEPKTWCMPIAGCLAYHGYFSKDDADGEAAQLRAAGYDVHVGSVIAYSTIGWFADPVLNTMLGLSDPELAGLLFHELAHQKLFIKDDTAMNESFATAVEREGLRRWLAAKNAAADYTVYLERAQRREAFTQLIIRYRDRLQTLYGSALTDDAKRASKQTLFDELRGDYAKLKTQWNGYAGFDRWMENINNARFVATGLYHGYVPAFEALLAQHGGDLASFYRAAEALAREPKESREPKLAALAVNSAVDGRTQR